ncbi:hypothetical protein PSN13_06516 [Micromonospora saelicesensis]|uniref:Uncharacterized protein n=1 Tax=Micromonospora saelicesensis TaxID=285676 RepID=A0A328NCT3_9ACTN|nr:hypothetical protein PSN13_06516 [Micromonospora saelicesensis]
MGSGGRVMGDEGMGEQREHQWERTKSGEVDEVAHEIANHNGPRCTVCGFFFCGRCYPRGWTRVCPGPAPEGTAWIYRLTSVMGG